MSATFYIFLYLLGVAFEFIRTVNQLNFLEEIGDPISEEINLRNKEMFIALLVISFGWIIIEPIMLIKQRNNFE